MNTVASIGCELLSFRRGGINGMAKEGEEYLLECEKNIGEAERETETHWTNIVWFQGSDEMLVEMSGRLKPFPV
jgi:hypothetical protein